MKSLHPIVGDLPRQAQWPLGASPAQARIGDELKTMFDTLTAGPLPDRLVQLADALDEAFRRGELYDTPPSRRAS
jgi:hypothetical protein